MASKAAAVLPKLAVSHKSINWHKVSTGHSAIAVSIVLTDESSTSPVHISSIVSSDPAFVASQECVATISASGSCSLSISFFSNSPGKHSAKVEISDDAAHSPQIITLKATSAGAPVPTPTLTATSTPTLTATATATATPTPTLTPTATPTPPFSMTSFFSSNTVTISTSEGAPYGDADFWLGPSSSGIGSTNFGYGPTTVIRLYICLSGEVSVFSSCSEQPTPTGPYRRQCCMILTRGSRSTQGQAFG